MADLLTFTPSGIYCPRADLYIDPWRPVARAVVTHAHSDHARAGMGRYLAHHDSLPVMRHRLGADIAVRGLVYGEAIEVQGVRISLHPAGHIIGSAQVRLEYRGEVWVVSGDYKLEDDGLSAPFEPVRCDVFITESTFGLPIFRWQPQAAVFADINAWWAANAAAGRTSLLACYALGKAQRVLRHLDPAIGPVYTHAAIEQTHAVLRAAGIDLPPTRLVQVANTSKADKAALRQALVLAPPSATGSPWVRHFQPHVLGVTSGWMALRGTRRRQAADQGFVLSDHADWDGLRQAIDATGAGRVFVTHGYTELFARWLHEERGLDARAVETRFDGDEAPESSEAQTPQTG
ncbi:MAG: ligase-associated DNA damage response exonuclease [Bacteroidia bacterium]